MIAPTFVASYSSSYSTTTTPKTVSVTTLPGDVLVVYGGSENGAGSLSTPSGNSISFTANESINIGASWATAYIWSGTDTTGGTSWTLTCTNSSSQQWGFTCVVFRGSDGSGGSGKTNSAAGLPVVNNITTVSNNSAIVIFNADWNAVNGSSRTWSTINGITPTSGNSLELDYYYGGSTYTIYGAYYSDVGAAGTPTPGLNAPGGQQWSTVAVEVKGTSPPFISTIFDNFDDNSMNATLWSSYTAGGCTVAETGGQLVLTPATNSVGYCGYNSLKGYNLTASQAVVEVVQTVGTGTGCQLIMGLSNGSNAINILINSTALVFRINNAGTYDETSVTRDDVAMRCWRIRESGGTIYWETSPDRATWTTRRSSTVGFLITNLVVSLEAGTWQNEASPGVGIFDNFNIGANSAITGWLRA